MGTMFDEIGDDVAALIREQQMFFVGTANAVSIDGLRGLRLS